MPQFNLKVPKGTRDWWGEDAQLRKMIFSTMTSVFEFFGAEELDTPVFELKEILSGKYGEDSKLIYDLADQGGELCSLRYDLTVPFARWLATWKVENFKRYHIAKVYRRDQPAMTKGRLREFYQCDVDFAGTYDRMLADAQVLVTTCEVFKKLGWKDNFTIKINHRKILDGIFQVCGVPKDKLRTISSAVDKLDKAAWEEVRKEMTEEKGLDPEVADKIGGYVVQKGGRELLQKLQADPALADAAKDGLEDMALLFDYLESYQVLHHLSFDMSLARGLDYYTGVIFEVVTEGSAPQATEAQRLQKAAKKTKSKDDDASSDPTVGVGSVAAGGRYDELVGMFSGNKQIPCVGISFGVDRIISITKARQQQKSGAALGANQPEVFVMAFGGKGFTGLLKERMEICKMLWDANIKADFSWKVKPKLSAQFKAAESGSVPYAVILGEDELAAGQVKIKEMGLPEGHPEKDGVMVARDQLVAEVKRRLAARVDDAGELVAATNGLSVN